MATAEYSRTDAQNGTQFTHTIDPGINGAAIFCDNSAVSLSISFQPTGMANFYPLATAANGGLAAGQNSTGSDVLSAGGTLRITPRGIPAGATVNIGVLELA